MALEKQFPERTGKIEAAFLEIGERCFEVVQQPEIAGYGEGETESEFAGVPIIDEKWIGGQIQR